MNAELFYSYRGNKVSCIPDSEGDNIILVRNLMTTWNRMWPFRVNRALMDNRVTECVLIGYWISSRNLIGWCITKIDMIGCCLTNRVMIGCSWWGCLQVAPDCVSGMIFSRVTLTETDQEPSVLEEVDKDIERAIEICQEAGESTGTFYIMIKLSMNTSLATKGALSHRLQRRTACNTSPPEE